MPALVLFDQRTMFAGDDLRCCTRLHAVWRIFQLVLSIGMAATHFFMLLRDPSLVDDIRECQENDLFTSTVWNGRILLYVYEFGEIFLCLTSLVVSAFTHSVSGRGTPTDPSLRKPLVPLCYFEMIFINILRFILLTIGCLCIYALEVYCECLSDNSSFDSFQEIRSECGEFSPFVTMIFILVGTHIVDAIFAFLTLIYFTCGCAPQVNIISSAQRCSIFLRCCFCCSSVLTCCLFGGREAVFGDFAEFSVIIANYLNNNKILDLTASDVLMGLDLVRRERRKRTLEVRGRIIQESTKIEVLLMEESMGDGEVDIEAVRVPEPKRLEEKDTSFISSSHGQDPLALVPKKEVLSVRDKEEVFLMAEAAHFVVYAHAAYTWVSFILEHPITGFCSLAYQILRQCACFCHSSEKGTIQGDHLWRPHTIALELISGLSSNDILYASFFDTLDAIPNFIALDHEWKTIIVAIRGTITLESVLADLNCVPHELSEMGEQCGFNGKGLYCHRGMLHSAKWVYKDLSRHGILDQAMKEHSGYRLRVVGHSLGAAAASILSVFLRPKYPDLRCLAFSPPGCTMSEELAEASAEYTYSFTIDDDIIARMSIEGFEELRDSVLEMICRVKIPKYQVSQQLKRFDFSTIEGVTQSIEESLSDKEKTQQSKFKEQVEEFWKFQAELKAKTDYVRLCPPGTIVHLFRTRSNRRSARNRDIRVLANSLTNLDASESDSDRQDNRSTRRYTARWAKRDDIEKIEISAHMLLDHDPIGVKLKIQSVARDQFGLKDPFLWDE